MTSMPLTMSIGTADAAGASVARAAAGVISVCESGSDTESLRFRHRTPSYCALRPVLLGAIALRQLLLLRVLRRRRADHRIEDLEVGLVATVGHDVPLLAVPGLDLRGVSTFMVLARGLDRLHEARHAELLDRVGRNVQMLEAPAHLLAGERLLAEFLLRLAHGLDAEHRGHHPAVVEHLADVLLLAGALALVVDILDDVVVDRALAGRREEDERVVALRAVARRDDVGLGAGPPHAVHLVARIAGGDRLLDCRRVHHAPAPEEHVIGALLADLQPRRLLL